MKSRGIRFPGRDNESLAPVFTPPRSVPEEEANTYVSQQPQPETPIHDFSEEQIKLAFDVARNSIELLSTVLSSAPKQDVLKVAMFFLKWVCLFIVTPHYILHDLVGTISI